MTQYDFFEWRFPIDKSNHNNVKVPNLILMQHIQFTVVQSCLF